MPTHVAKVTIYTSDSEVRMEESLPNPLCATQKLAKIEKDHFHFRLLVVSRTPIEN